MGTSHRRFGFVKFLFVAVSDCIVLSAHLCFNLPPDFAAVDFIEKVMILLGSLSRLFQELSLDFPLVFRFHRLLFLRSVDLYQCYTYVCREGLVVYYSFFFLHCRFIYLQALHYLLTLPLLPKTNLEEAKHSRTFEQEILVRYVLIACCGSFCR